LGFDAQRKNHAATRYSHRLLAGEPPAAFIRGERFSPATAASRFIAEGLDKEFASSPVGQSQDRPNSQFVIS